MDENNWDDGADQNNNVLDIEIALLLEAIFRKYSYDFREYARSSVKRRLRQAAEKLGCSTITEMQARVLHEEEFFTQLLTFLTVPVTEMFRDPSYFRAVRDEVIPELKTYPSLKIWVAGCSTGEEAYSMAILLHEEGLLAKTIIYATDISPESLRKAKQGVFDLDLIAKYTKNYQDAGGRRSFSDYYTADYQHAILERTLKNQIVFSDHSLATDAVFSETNFISCRNVMIYFDKKLQDRAIGLFRDSLVRRGLLGIGSKENLKFSSHADHFQDFIPSEKIYRRI